MGRGWGGARSVGRERGGRAGREEGEARAGERRGTHLAKVDNVHRDRVLLELLAELDERRLGVGDRGADEDDDPLPLVLVLAVLERELRHLDAGGDVDLAADRDAVREREDLADVARQRDVERDARPRHREHAHRVLGVRLALGARQQVDRVLLRLHPRRREVAVPHEVGVVDAEDAGLEHHGETVRWPGKNDAADTKSGAAASAADFSKSRSGVARARSS